MKNLMKYELRKTLFTKEILLGVTAAAEIAFLLGLYLEKRNLLGIAVFLLTCLAIGGVMVFGLQSVLTLHRDMNTKQSYMLFMTPNSSFKILGAKVLENGLSILLTGACFFALGALDVTLLFAKEGTLQELWDAIERLLHSINENIEITGAGMACFTLSLLASWICIVTTAYLAVVISSALLNGKRFNGLLSFVLFLALTILITWVQQKAVSGAGHINVFFLLQAAIALGFSAVMYAATAQIMETKLSV